MQDFTIQWEKINMLHEVADEIEKELIDCDAWDGSGSYAIDHASCYFGGQARMMVLDKADILEAAIYEAEHRERQRGKT